MKHVDACERSSPFNASAPLFVVRRDPTKLGGFLITQADAGEQSSPFCISNTMNKWSFDKKVHVTYNTLNRKADR